jgi:hypothetical protein
LGRVSPLPRLDRLNAWSWSSDIDAAREDLIRRGVEVSELFHRDESRLAPARNASRPAALAAAGAQRRMCAAFSRQRCSTATSLLPHICLIQRSGW